jgi:predicted Zn-dependent protease
MSHNFRRNESTSNAISSQVKKMLQAARAILEKIAVRRETAGISGKKAFGTPPMRVSRSIVTEFKVGRTSP